MLEERERYLSPVGFATEPAGEKRKWLGRVALLAVVLGVGWLLFNRVFPPPQDVTPDTVQLPGPF